LKLKEIESTFIVCTPLIKVSEASYLIGAELKMVEIKSNQTLIRTGGGFEPLSEYLTKYSKSQCLKLHGLMEEQRCRLVDVIENLLKKHEAHPQEISDF
jgi:hypothetical protein